MREEQINNNPCDICTWRPNSACEDCSIAGRLKCHYRSADLFRFVGTFFLFAVPALVGMILGGYGWYIAGWVGFMVLFFSLWEIRILCSHCPYYAEEGRVLHCIANYGSPKVWRYHPEPMSTSEKIQLMIGFVILIGYPFPFILLGNQYAMALVALFGGVIFFGTLRKTTCSRCVNFSCPLNLVPKDVVDDFLTRNPVMRKAWEENGWVVGKSEL